MGSEAIKTNPEHKKIIPFAPLMLIGAFTTNTGFIAMVMNLLRLLKR